MELKQEVGTEIGTTGMENWINSWIRRTEIGLGEQLELKQEAIRIETGGKDGNWNRRQLELKTEDMDGN